MKLLFSIDEIKVRAKMMLEQAEALEKLTLLALPGRFVFSPPGSSRLCVSTLDELHEARSALRLYGWKDKVTQKFFCQGEVIAVFTPEDDVILPLPFEIWVQARPEAFPKEILGDCEIKKTTSDDYYIVCPVKS